MTVDCVKDFERVDPMVVHLRITLASSLVFIRKKTSHNILTKRTF